MPFMGAGETMIRVKSIHAPVSDDDGFRVLIEPEWPGRASRRKTVMDVWLRDLAPSRQLYSLFMSGTMPWEDFLPRYQRELERNRIYFPDLRTHGANGGLTLLHGYGREDANIAVALKMRLERPDPEGIDRASG
jgi:uncharacterized protein YeaO (DUF488 family)